MIIIRPGDEIRVNFYLLRRVGHSHSHAGGVEHGNVVFSVSGRYGIRNGDAEMIADKAQGISFAGRFVEYLQILVAAAALAAVD